MGLVVSRRPSMERLDGASVTTQSPLAASRAGRNGCFRAVPPTTRVFPTGWRAGQADTLDRRRAARGRARQLDHLCSWITFNVGNDPIARDACAQVMAAFF